MPELPPEETEAIQQVSDMMGIPVAGIGGALFVFLLTNSKAIFEAGTSFFGGLWKIGKIVYRIVQYVEQVDPIQERMDAQEERMRYLFDITDLDYDNLESPVATIAELTPEEAELIQALRARKNDDPA